MPEIAEVETVRQTLRKKILRKKIKNVNVIYNKIVESDLDEFKKNLINQEFTEIYRRGKWLIFEVGEYYLCSHLRMEGKYFIKQHAEEITKHEHIIFEFSDGTDLRYHDTRKFGRMNLVKKENLESVPGVHKQGIEPIDDKLTKEYLFAKFHPRKLPMKTLLLDQTIISGLGNIYADEVLFASKILPTKLGTEITISDCAKIATQSKKIITEAIACGGTTIRSYTSSLGVTGRFQQNLKVHQQATKPCPTCGTAIQKITIGGRGTYYCEKCQK